MRLEAFPKGLWSRRFFLGFLCCRWVEETLGEFNFTVRMAPVFVTDRGFCFYGIDCSNKSDNILVKNIQMCSLKFKFWRDCLTGKLDHSPSKSIGLYSCSSAFLEFEAAWFPFLWGAWSAERNSYAQTPEDSEQDDPTNGWNDGPRARIFRIFSPGMGCTKRAQIKAALFPNMKTGYKLN